MPIFFFKAWKCSQVEVKLCRDRVGRFDLIYSTFLTPGAWALPKPFGPAQPHAASMGDCRVYLATGQPLARPWHYLGISAGLGNPARTDSLSSLKNKWRARTTPTSPHRKPGSIGWSTLWKKMKAKISFFEQGDAVIPLQLGLSRRQQPSPFHPWPPGRFSLWSSWCFGSFSLHSKEYSSRKIWP